MPTWAATLLVGFCTVVTNLIVTAYYFGKLAQRVETHDKTFDQMDERFNGFNEDQRRQWHEITDQGKGLEKIKGKLGVNGA